VVDYDAGAAEKPTFTIETDDDDDDDWTVVQTTITTEPTIAQTWVQQSGTFDNPIERQVRIKFYKLGGTTAAQTNLNQLMFVDDVSLNYAGAITTTTDDTTLADLTINGSTVAGFTRSGTTYDVELTPGTTDVPTVAATLYNTNGSSVITAATSLPGTTTIVITAEDGATQRTVSINFTVQTLTPGQEFLVNPGVNSATGANTTTPVTGVDGSGNMPANLGGWGSGANGSFAPSSTGNGSCHSEDRQFKFFKSNNSFVYQDVTLPAGNYDWTFYTSWLVLVNWDAEGDVTPKFTIETDDDQDGTWTVVQTTITTEPTTTNTWEEQTGTYINDTARTVRIKFSKSGGGSAAPTNLNQIMAIDDVSFK